MTSIQSPQDLLVHLAGNGDPSAFYTLAAPSIRTTYIDMRKHGKSHAEAMAVLVPFLKKIQKNYLAAGSRDVPFGEWYEAQQTKHLSNNTDPQNEKAVPVPIPAEDLSDFESQMRLVFQQTYHNLVVTKKGSSMKRRSNSGLPAKLTAAILGVLLVAAGLQLYFTLSGTTISFSISSPGRNRLFSLPAKTNKPVNSPQPMAAVPPASFKADTVKPYKAQSSDSMNPNPVKKPSPPRLHPRISSSPPAAAPAPAPSAKPLPDSATVFSKQIEPEKSPALPEKTGPSASLQRKQAVSPQDSLSKE
ncbi:MAG TPA: hypothetical protein VLX68_13425 [Chitinivibrionales bacterium]|nr:hypothetical protein [Chitinivibrionales bacterium]